jgi:hypothetical protein
MSDSDVEQPFKYIANAFHDLFMDHIKKLELDASLHDE